MMRFALLTAAAILCGSTNAAEICYGPTAPATVAATPNASTMFTCPTAGSGTMNQLATLGWRIVRLTPVSTGGGNAATQLVIRRASDSIFSNGFES